MRRFLLVLVAISFIVGAAASSAIRPVSTAFLIQQEDRNPWTHLRLNNDPEEFQFAIVSDRTGGHREKIFSAAVEQLNLMQPEFVMSVGDLIEGYSEEQERVAQQWREFQSFVSRLEMPFFYVMGNHDVTNLPMEKTWKEKFGRRYYHFVYKNVLFVSLSSEDPPGTGGGTISSEQHNWLKQVLAENNGVRWTLLFLHKPMWVTGDPEKNGWLEVEKIMAGRIYTVFSGHVHRYRKFVRNGMRYYQFATTGGGSKLRGTQYGEFDHLVWVTMKKEGPLLANVMLDGIYPEDLNKPVTVEPGDYVYNRRPTYPVRGTVHLDGAPLPGAYVVFQTADASEKVKFRADGQVEPDGTFRLSTYTAYDGIPAGDYAVTITLRRPLYLDDGRPGPNMLPDRYSKPETSGLRVTIKNKSNDVQLELSR